MHAVAVQVVVRWPGGAQSVVISIDTAAASKILNRDPQEPLHKALARLQTSLAGALAPQSYSTCRLDRDVRDF